ncbi:MAG: hypothetical protein AB7K71_12610 [Polyangiaceae bacterium]
MSARKSVRVRTALVVLLGLGLSGLNMGCQEDKPKTTAKEVDAGPPKTAVDPNLAKAVAAASANMGSGSPIDTNGPPENGVFPPGIADKRLAKGSLPKVELGNEGSGTKVNLAELLFKPGTKQTQKVRLQFQPGPRTPPINVDFELAFELVKPKAAEGAEPKENLDLVVKFVKVTLDSTVTGELAKSLAKLKGSKVTYPLAANGGAMALQLELSKDAEPDVEDLARGVAENVMASLIAYPDKPVGKDAVWMASVRDPHQGVDGLAYRMVKVTSITGEGADTVVELEISSKYYAADSSIKRLGIPAGVNPVIQQFRSEGHAVLTFHAGKPAPEGLSSISTLIMMTDSADPQKQMSMQGSTQLAFGDKGMALAKAVDQARAAQAAEQAQMQQRMRQLQQQGGGMQGGGAMPPDDDMEE